MPSFSKRSRDRLDSCHPDLARLFLAVIEHHDCTILEGARDVERQKELFRQGKSKLDGVTAMSKHQPVAGFSMAADVAPYPIDWNNRERFVYFAGIVKGHAEEMGISIRWGGDWDGDNDLRDQSFMDLPHFELD